MLACQRPPDPDWELIITLLVCLLFYVLLLVVITNAPPPLNKGVSRVYLRP